MIWLYLFLLDFLIPFLCDPDLQYMCVQGKYDFIMEHWAYKLFSDIKQMFKEPIKAAHKFQKSKEVTDLSRQIQMNTNSHEGKQNLCTN